MKYYFFFLFVIFFKTGLAQTNDVSEVMKMNSKQFLTWVERIDNDFVKRHQINLISLIKNRLEGPLFTNDLSIVKIVTLVLDQELSSINCKDFFDEILTLTVDRKLLAVELFQLNLDCLETTSKTKISDYSYIDVFQKIERLEYELLLKKSELALRIGQSLVEKQLFEDAEVYFRKILIYPWYAMKDGKLKSKMALLYVEAGKGILECRKDKPELLKRTFFFPPARPILNPIKEKMLKRFETEKK